MRAAHTPELRAAGISEPGVSCGAAAADLVHRVGVEEKVTQLTNQSRAIDRLHIPAYNWWSEALHGVASSGTTSPEPVGLASTLTRRYPSLAIAIGIEARIKRAQFDAPATAAPQEGLDFWARILVDVFATRDGDAGEESTARTRS